MEELVSFIEQYWLGAIFGVICAALGRLCLKFKKLYIAEKHHQKTEEQTAFYEGLKDVVREASQKSRDEEEKLQQQINSIRNGVLSLQGRNFKQECREYLRPSREFSIEEFEDLQHEYDVYKDLGGNHDGDTLFSLVNKKAQDILTDDK